MPTIPIPLPKPTNQVLEYNGVIYCLVNGIKYMYNQDTATFDVIEQFPERIEIRGTQIWLKRLCNCDTATIFNLGCQCGGA